jgi:chemotaxis protein CheX
MTSATDTVDAQSTYLPLFIDSTKAVLSTMLGWDVEVGPMLKSENTRTAHDVSGIIGFGGPLQCTIAVSVEKEVAFAAAEAFLGERPTVVDADVRDLVAELANMIGGGAKERIGRSDIALGLPTSVSGDDHVISFDRGADVETVEFKCPFGSLTVLVAIRS